VWIFLHRVQKGQGWDSPSATPALRRVTFPTVVKCLLHYTGETGAATEATMGKLRMAYEAVQRSEKGRKWAALSC